MSLDEYYSLMEQEEKERKASPCCENCRFFYTEYGQAFCKKHDYPTEKNICKNWN